MKLPFYCYIHINIVLGFPLCMVYLQLFCFTLTAAISNLNGIILYGQKIHVTLSKHAQVQMPQAGSNVCSQLDVNKLEGALYCCLVGTFCDTLLSLRLHHIVCVRLTRCMCIPSKELSCSMSAEEILFIIQEDGLTEDYTSSPLHRFKVCTRYLIVIGSRYIQDISAI